MAHNTQTATNYLPAALTSLGEELSRIAKALVRVSMKLQEYARVRTVKVTPKTDPDMFTEEFMAKVKKSHEDIEKGRVVDYSKFRKTLFTK